MDSMTVSTFCLDILIALTIVNSTNMSNPAPSFFTDSFFSLQAVKGTMSPQFTEHICQVHVVVEKELVDQVAQGDMQVMTQKVTTRH